LIQKSELIIKNIMTEAINSDTASIKRSALFVTTLAVFLPPFGVSSVNIALPLIAQEFQMDAILLGWVTTAYLLVSAVFLVPFGKVADMYGRKRIFTYGILTFTLASLGSCISNSAAMLICFRILQGIGSAGIYCIGAAILTSVFPPRELGKALGINVAAVYLGHSAGPFFGGCLAQNVGWRSIFVVNVLLGLIIIVLIFWRLKGEWREAEEKKFNRAGAIIYIVTLSLIMYGFSHLSTMLGVWLILPGVLGLIAFIKWETRIENPLLDIGIFKDNRVFVFSNLATLINYSATFAATFLLSLYLQYVKAFPPQKAGLILVSQPIVQAFLSPFAGKLSDRIEARIVASIGMALTGVGLSLLALLDEKTTVEFIIASLVLLGFGLALFSSPTINAAMSSVESRFYGVASGALGTMRWMGMVFSMGITLLIFSMYLGEIQITPEYYPVLLRCTKLAFTFFAVLCFGGIFVSLARGKVL
jgi:EmrB/QacA subfamily drug resistance transporter